MGGRNSLSSRALRQDPEMIISERHFALTGEQNEEAEAIELSTSLIVINARINCMQDDDLVEKEIYYIISYSYLWDAKCVSPN